MLSAGEFRKGQTVEIDGAVWVIVDFQHVKPGKGAAFVRTKIKNVVNGNVLERTFSPTERYPRAHVETKSMETILPVMETENAPFLHQDAEVWQTTADWLHERGLLKEKTDVSNLFVNLLEEE